MANDLSATISAFDWAGTPLGPMHGWPRILRSTVDIMLAQPLAMAVVWGPEFIQIYNDAYAATFGIKHPATLGQPNKEVLPGIESINGSVFSRVMRGESVLIEDQHVQTPRHGGMTDACFTYAVSPLRDDGGNIGGLLLIAIETTPRVVAEQERERRLAVDANLGRDAEYQSLFEAMDEGFLLAEVFFDEQGQTTDLLYLAANPAAMRMTGVDYVGRQLLEIDPGYEPYWLEIWGRVARSGIGERHQRYAAPLKAWFDFFVFRVGGEGSHRVAVVFSDITDQKRHDANTAFLAGITDDFDRLASADEMLQRVGEKIGAYLDIASCKFIDVDLSRDKQLNVSYFWGRPGVARLKGEFYIKDFLTPEFERASLAGEMMIIRNTHADSRADPHAYDQIDVHACVGIPFFHLGEWKSYITFSDRRPRDWRDSELELFRAVANIIFPRLERARALAAVRASQERQTFLLRLSDALRPLADPVEIQAEAVRVLGTQFQVNRVAYYEVFQTDYVIERDYVDGVPSLAGRYPVASFGQKLYTAHLLGRPIIVEDVEADSDLSPAERAAFAAIQIRAYIGVPLVKDGQVVAGLTAQSALPRKWTADEVSLIQDTAERTWSAVERARAEAELRDSEERQAFLLRLSDALRPLTDPVAIQGVASRLLREHFDAGWCYYVEWNETGTVGTVVREDTREGLHKFAGIYDISDLPALSRFLRAGRLLNVPNFADFPLFNARAVEQYDAIGMRSVLGAPLVKNGRLISVLMLADTSPRQWSKTAITLVWEVAERTWAAVERARAAAQLRESEERFRVMADAVPQIVWITDADGRVVFFNRQWSEYTGATFDPATAAEVAAHFIHPDDGPATMAAFNEARQTGGRFAVEHRIRSAAGAYRWFIVRGEPYRDPNSHEITRWFGASVDIHDRVEAEAALRQSEERFRLLVENARDHAVFTLGLDGRVSSWNPGAERIFGYTSDELIGQSGAVLFTPEDQSAGEFDRELETATQKGRASDDRWQLRKGGARFWASGVTSSMLDDQGQPRGFTKVLRDMTEGKRAEQEREQLLAQERLARAEAEQVAMMKDQFLATVSHELRTPLSAILIWSKLLKDGMVPEGALAQAVEAIAHSADAQKQVIDDLLDTS
ncbi:MAG: multi-sensor signal transduction histidine kinase, partial [Phycisphaerales bacterium]|nr:multi-sensor signal transduction histidine kinase [Phycisphaerales bacterium]